MTTLFIQKAGGRARKLASLGGEPGTYAVSDGKHVLASGRTGLLQGGISHSEMHIEAGDHRLTATMGWKSEIPSELEVVDDRTGQKIFDGTRIAGQRQNQEWTVSVPSGQSISWVYRASEEKLGFFDANGAPIMRMGHDPSFDTAAKGGTLRVLFRFWTAAVASTDRFVVFVDDDLVSQVVKPDDVPVLALLGMWLERLAEGDTSASSGFS